MKKIHITLDGGNISICINGQEYSLEAFEATDAAEMGLSDREAKSVMAHCDAILDQVEHVATQQLH